MREDVEVFAVTLNVTLPFPLPDVLLSVNHDASFDMVHDVFDVTEMLLPELAVAATLFDVGKIESEGVGDNVIALDVVCPPNEAVSVTD